MQFYNVNIPPNARGIAWTKQSVRHYEVSITPLRLDLTDHMELERQRSA